MTAEYTPPTHGKSILEKIWDDLDTVIDSIKGTSKTDIFDPLIEEKARANALAGVLVLMCQPYYETSQDILRQANRRWKMRTGQMDFEPTPGYKYNPQPAGTKYVTERTPPPKAARTTRQTESKLNEKQMRDIKAAAELGLTVQELSEMYKVTQVTIKQIIDNL